MLLMKLCEYICPLQMQNCKRYWNVQHWHDFSTDRKQHACKWLWKVMLAVPAKRQWAPHACLYLSKQKHVVSVGHFPLTSYNWFASQDETAACFIMKVFRRFTNSKAVFKERKAFYWTLWLACGSISSFSSSIWGDRKRQNFQKVSTTRWRKQYIYIL